MSQQALPITFNDAITFLNRAKERYAHDPATYRQFLELLQRFQREQISIEEVNNQVAVLFHGNEDLVHDFRGFLPAQQ